MTVKRKVLILAAMCIVCTAASKSQSPLNGYSENGISKMFLDAHAPDQPHRYSRSEIKEMIQDAKSSEDFERLADYFDYQSLEFDRKADDQVKELERLLALPFRARSYPTQVETTRELIKKYRAKADECADRASGYHAQTTATAPKQ